MRFTLRQLLCIVILVGLSASAFIVFGGMHAAGAVLFVALGMWEIANRNCQPPEDCRGSFRFWWMQAPRNSRYRALMGCLYIVMGLCVLLAFSNADPWLGQ